MSARPRPAPEPAEVLRKALLRAAERLGLSQKDLGEIVGLSGASVSRIAAGRLAIEPTSKNGELALLFLRAYRGLDAVVGGDEEKARSWFHAKNMHLGPGRVVSPIERARTVEGLVDVAQYLDAVRGKL